MPLNVFPNRSSNRKATINAPAILVPLLLAGSAVPAVLMTEGGEERKVQIRVEDPQPKPPSIKHVSVQDYLKRIEADRINRLDEIYPSLRQAKDHWRQIQTAISRPSIMQRSGRVTVLSGDASLTTEIVRQLPPGCPAMRIHVQIANANNSIVVFYRAGLNPVIYLECPRSEMRNTLADALQIVSQGSPDPTIMRVVRFYENKPRLNSQSQSRSKLNYDPSTLHKCDHRCNPMSATHSIPSFSVASDCFT